MAIADGALLEAHDLACRRSGRLVFEQLSFSLAPGETLILRGPNGSGKSSLLRLLAGLIRPAAGYIAWEAAPIDGDLPAHRARLHYVAHADALKAPLTARENLDFFTALAGGGENHDLALDAFALQSLADLPVRYLSAGQRRRAALARLLAVPRPLWLLDEPGVGLDAASRERLERAISDHRDGGGVVIVATHGDVAPTSALVLDMPG